MAGQHGWRSSRLSPLGGGGLDLLRRRQRRRSPPGRDLGGQPGGRRGLDPHRNRPRVQQLPGQWQQRGDDGGITAGPDGRGVPVIGPKRESLQRHLGQRAARLPLVPGRHQLRNRRRGRRPRQQPEPDRGGGGVDRRHRLRADLHRRGPPAHPQPERGARPAPAQRRALLRIQHQPGRHLLTGHRDLPGRGPDRHRVGHRRRRCLQRQLADRHPPGHQQVVSAGVVGQARWRHLGQSRPG